MAPFLAGSRSMIRGTTFFVLLVVLVRVASGADDINARTQTPPAAATVESCFLLYELGAGEVRRDPSQACRTRITPASTFKVPHALAALDAGLVTPTEVFRYDGTGDWPASARRDHTLGSALHHSVLWLFQRIAQRLGPEREAAYLK